MPWWERACSWPWWPCYAAELVADAAGRRGIRVLVAVRAAGAVLFLAANVVVSLQGHQARVAYQGHVRPDVKPYDELVHVRPDFTALVRELGRDRYKDCLVLGTFDHQLHNWWVAFGPGFVFDPNPFRSTLPDREIERRVLLLAHIIGFEDRDAVALLLWLGSDKYQATRTYSFAPPQEYSPADAEEMKRFGFRDSWHLALPLNERDRLLALCRSLAEQPAEAAPRLDVLVLLNTSDQINLAPDAQRWVCSYRNGSYRVFVRTPRTGSIAGSGD
jgi:hypothetical protein